MMHNTTHASLVRRPWRRPSHWLVTAGRVLKVLPLALALCSGPVIHAQINPLVAGLPRGGTVATGSASVAGSLSSDQLTLTLTQTGGNRSVIDWQSFNIDSGRTVQFVQPSPSSAVLNRVPAGGLSEIGGTMTANGLVLLMNPNGVLFKSGASINVGSLIATTGTVNQSDFLGGGSFGITGANGNSVVNQGTITAVGAGLVALVAPSVSNQGSITATGGRIALSGADLATITFNSGLYEFAVPSGALGTNATVANAAAARLDGATLLLSTGDAAALVSGVINLQGVQHATSAIVVNGNTVVLKSDLDAPTISGNTGAVQVYPGASIQDAVKIARTGTPGAGATVEVQAGTFTEQLALNKANLTLSGQAGARLVVPDLAEVNGIAISANNVKVQGLEIAGPINAPYYDYYATPKSNVSRGIAISDGITGFTLRSNNIHDVRNGILIHGRNSTGTVSNNTIENTKSGISVQYTDAAGITIADNLEGPIGNEWGVNLHLNGHLNGAGTILSNTPPIATAPTADWQQSLLSLSTRNNGWGVQDQGYTASNRTRAMVATTGAASNQGSRLTPVNTIQGGVNAVVAGGQVTVAAGTYTQASTLNISKALTLAGASEATTIIDARGVSGGYGMSVSANDVTLRDFTFYGPSAFYASAYGIKVSPGGNADARLRNFTISNVTSRGAGKAELDLNGVDGALIDQVTLNGAPVGNDTGSTQGAGLQLTDSANVTVRNTTTLNNAWGGVALYQANRSYNQQVNNIRIEGSNRFNETNPVYMQDESALHDFGHLEIAGFGYAVRNADSDSSRQYTWLQATPQQAYDYAVNLPGATASYIQGWDGSAATPNFSVGMGNLTGGGTQAMSIGAALDHAGSGANIDVGAGTYAENVTVNRRYTLRFNDVTVHGLTLNAGASDTAISGKLTADASTGLVFNAPIGLLGDTILAANGADITLAGHVQNAGSTPQALTLTAGTGGNRGDVSMISGGSASNPLGTLTVSARRYTLTNTLWVLGYHIDALGDVALSNHTLIATDTSRANTLTAAGDVTGAIDSKGSVDVVSNGNVQANISADGAAKVTATNITGAIVSGSNIELQASGDVAATVTAAAGATVSARDVSGTIAGRDVSVSAQRTVDVAITATNSAALAGENVQGSVSAPSTTVHADANVNLSGTSDQISIDAPHGSVSGNFGEVSNAGSGVFSVNGKPVLNPVLSANAENSRMIPVHVTLPELGAGMVPAGARPLQLLRSSPAAAAASLEQGQAVEIELLPGNDRERN